MENQHRAITGYQEMDQQKIDLFNKITAIGQQIEQVCQEVAGYTILEEAAKKEKGEVIIYPQSQNPDRWMALAKTEFQVGLMMLKRSLAKPTTF